MKNQTKTKIGVGSVVKAKVGELENITREGIRKKMSKEVLICVQILVWKNKFLVQFKDIQKKKKSSSSIVILSSKDEVEMDEAISHSPKKEKGELSIIVGDPEVG